jgi:hypothetical protein
MDKFISDQTVDYMNRYAENLMEKHRKGTISDKEYREKCVYMVSKYIHNISDIIEKCITIQRENNIPGLWIREKLFKREKTDKKYIKKKFVKRHSPLNKMTKC